MKQYSILGSIAIGLLISAIVSSYFPDGLSNPTNDLASFAFMSEGDPAPVHWVMGYYEQQEPLFVAEMFGIGLNGKMDCPTNFVLTTHFCPVVCETNGVWTITFDF